MIELVVAMLLAVAPQADEPEVLSGRCDYPVALGRERAGETRIKCDGAVISSASDGVLVQFASKADGGIYGFAGPIENDLMNVRRIYLPGGRRVAASGGHCELFQRADIITGVSCVGNVGPRSYDANFRAFAP